MVRLLVINDEELKTNNMKQLLGKLKDELEIEFLQENLNELELYENEEIDEYLLKEDFVSNKFSLKSQFILCTMVSDIKVSVQNQTKISNILTNLLKSNLCFDIIWKNEYQAYILFDKNLDIKIIKSILKNLKLKIKKQIHIECIFITTRNYENFESLSIAMETQLKYIEYNFYYENEAVFLEELKPFKKIDYKNINNYLEILRFAKNKNVNKMISCINEILEGFKAENIYPGDVKNFIKFIFTNIKLVNLDITNGDVSFIDENIDIMDNKKTINELITFIEGLKEDLMNLFKENQYRNEISEVINFVNDNIDKKITLEMLAKHVSMNESYLSRIFKLETGISLTSYINNIKIEKASELLNDKNIMIKEVSGLVGIDDPFYFNKLFKKYKGSSPSEFRKILIK
ncbi:MAG: helix-turn-helix transcriptional regulator [Sarcina sp.]